VKKRKGKGKERGKGKKGR